MLYKPNWDEVQKKHLEFWALENHDRPLLHITAPRDKQVSRPLPAHATLRERWCDVEYMLADAHLRFENTYYGADAFPVLMPNLGPDLFAALYGVPLEFGEDTSWALYNMPQWEPGRTFTLQTDSFYYHKIVEMTKAAAEDGRDKYFVGITDIHPGLDALVGMRGPEGLCIDTLEYPDELKRASAELFEGYKALYNQLADCAGKYQQGTSTWMPIWHPGKWYVTSCDFICLISPAQFDELVLDELNAELDFFDASIFHLDGPDALRHLDRLLSIPKVRGIQWVYGAGQPTASHWLPVLQKIQAAGKAFQVIATPDEMPILLENLRPEGAMYLVETESEEDAVALEKLVGAR